MSDSVKCAFRKAAEAFLLCLGFVSAKFAVRCMFSAYSVITDGIGFSEAYLQCSSPFYHFASSAFVLLLLILYIKLSGFKIPMKNTKGFGFHELILFAIIGAGGQIAVSSVIRIISDSGDFTFSVGDLWIYIISSCLISVISEEILFRSVIYTKLRSVSGRYISLIISSLLFAFSHPTVISAVYAFVFGAVFALLYEKYSSVIPSVTAHFFFNISAFIYSGGGYISLLISAVSVILSLILILNSHSVKDIQK